MMAEQEQRICQCCNIKVAIFSRTTFRNLISPLRYKNMTKITIITFHALMERPVSGKLVIHLIFE